MADDELLVELPGGLALEDGRCLRAAVLRPLTGRAEDWLARHRGAPSALAVTRVLGLCLARLDELPGGPELARRLLVGDREFLMLRLRERTLGATIQAVFSCPACAAKMDVDLRADAVQVEPRPQTAASFSLELGQPGAERSVRFRLPTGADQEAALGAGAGAAEALFTRCLLDDGGAPLSDDEREAVIGAMEALAPQLDLELELACPECGDGFVTPFDTTAFFLSELRGGGRQLLAEVHHLALHYHWSEAEILGLTRERRRAYLALLGEALRRE
ncbi:MAG TPA: hypothetical protein PKD53_04420 [Chloroflexaceae bacterium]|nr:hypothetical protein [Chloroflexaceae bacterium]